VIENTTRTTLTTMTTMTTMTTITTQETDASDNEVEDNLTIDTKEEENKITKQVEDNQTVTKERKEFNFFAGDFLKPVEGNPGATEIAFTMVSDPVTADDNEYDATPMPKIETPILHIKNKTKIRLAVGSILDMMDDITKNTNVTVANKKHVPKTQAEKNQNKTLNLETEKNLKTAVDEILNIVDQNTKMINETFMTETKSFHNISEEAAEVIKTKDNVIAKQKVEIVKLGTIVELCLFVFLAMGLIVAVGCLCLRAARWC